MAEEEPATGLLSLPNEIMLLILTYACEEKLCPNLDLVCKSFRNLMVNIYRQSYGNGPTPSALIADSCWKEFALRHETYQERPEHWLTHDIWKFSEYNFLSQSNDIWHNKEERATELIYWLHANPLRHPDGLATIVGALCILNRKDEAQRLLKQYRKDDIPDEWKFLLCARFELDFSVDWAEVPPAYLGRCRQAAALRGDIDLLHTLRQNPLNDEPDITELDDQKAAIRGDSIELLRHLLDTPTNNMVEHSWNELIQEAAVFRRENALQLLLQRVGSQVDLQHAYQTALYQMDRTILNLFKGHSPHLLGSYLPNGELQIVHTMKVCAYSLTHHQAIEALVEHDSVYINAIGKDGLTAAHFAALRLDIKGFEFLAKLGADMESLGHIQQTPKEILSCRDDSGGEDFFSPELFEEKQKLAKRWLGVYMLALFNGRKGWNSNKHHVLQSTVHSLSSLWAKYIGLQTLKDLCSLLGTTTSKSMDKLGFIIRTYWYLNQNSSPTLCDPHTLLDIKEIQLCFGMDFGTAIANNFDLTAVAERAEPMLDPEDVEDILNNFRMDFGTVALGHVALTAVARYAARILDPVDIRLLRAFVNSDTGRAFRLRPFFIWYPETIAISALEED